jgi:16S rRNA (guanine527-N7)-methyltransferase
MSDNNQKLELMLETGLVAAGLEATPDKSGKLLAYLELLAKWNQAYNLTGIKKKEDMLSLNILDSLVLVPYVDKGRIADVGTGAGLPGIPLAIYHPDKQFILIDSNSKKTRFIFQATVALGLTNVTVVHRRVEDYASQPQVDIVTSRAFASLADFVQGCRHLLSPAGKFLAMKGQYPSLEISALPHTVSVSAVHPLKVPGLAAERHVVEIVFNKDP